MKDKEDLLMELRIHESSNATIKADLIRKELEKYAEVIKDPTGEDLYGFHKDGLSWAEIEELTGVKKPWVKASKFARDNDFEYPCKIQKKS